MEWVTYILGFGDNIFEELTVDLGIVSLLLHLKSKQRPCFHLGRLISWIHLQIVWNFQFSKGRLTKIALTVVSSNVTCLQYTVIPSFLFLQNFQSFIFITRCNNTIWNLRLYKNMRLNEKKCASLIFHMASYKVFTHISFSDIRYLPWNNSCCRSVANIRQSDKVSKRWHAISPCKHKTGNISSYLSTQRMGCCF